MDIMDRYTGIARFGLIVTMILAFAALLVAAQAPEAIAASKWLSLPGFVMPAWLPVVFALAACITAKLDKPTIALLLAITAGVLSIATIITALVSML